MARLGVTYQDIAQAATSLLNQGRKPTIELIRHRLGTGSSTTIANHLRQWRFDYENIITPAIKENVPQEMIGMLKGLWERLNVEASQKTTEIEVKSQQEVADLNLELAKYKTNNRRWQRLFFAWQKEKEALLNDAKLLKQKVTELEKEKITLEEKLTSEANQIKEKRIRIEELHKLHTQTQANLEHFRESTREQRLIQESALSLQKQEMQTEIKILREQAFYIKDQFASKQAQYHSLQQKYDELEKNAKQQTEALIHIEAEKKSFQQLGKASITKKATKLFNQLMSIIN